jgi:FkbM family methyltransferase
LEKYITKQKRHRLESDIRFGRLDWIQNGAGLIQAKDGLFVYPRADSIVSRCLGLYGEWSPGEMRLFKALLNPGDAVIEVGSHIGSHTVGLAKIVGGKGVVYAFEPQGYLYNCLIANAEINGLDQIIALNAGVGSVNETINIPLLDYTSPANFGCLSLDTNNPDLAHLARTNVEVITIDSLELSHLHFLKIDAEGMEPSVLAGASKTIQKYRPMLFMECDRPDAETPIRDILKSMKYAAWQHITHVFETDNWAGNPTDHTGGIVSLNLICIPEEKHPPEIVSNLKKIL